MNRKNRLASGGTASLFGCVWTLAALPALASAHPAASHVVRCADQRSFTVELTEEEASVRIGGQFLHLRRQASTSFTRYGSQDAALVIDGDYVAFVMTDALDFNGCHLSSALPDGTATVAPAVSRR